MAQSKSPRDGTTPFRFLDLPPELRTLVYEQVAYETSLRRSAPLNRNALLGTCKLIRKEYKPVLLSFARINLCVVSWQFTPVTTTIANLQTNKTTARALEANDRITIAIAAELWEDTHLERVKAWLKARLEKPAMDFQYRVWRPVDGVVWKSKSQFLWMAGVEELRQLQSRIEVEESAKEVGKIIAALVKEAEVLANGGATKRVDQQRRRLASRYGINRELGRAVHPALAGYVAHDSGRSWRRRDQD